MSSVTLGKYRLIAELGRGGMAEVFLAVTSSAASTFSKLVVVKKPREHLVNDVDFMTMLVDEARIAGRLNHPNLVQTLEVGEENGQYFIMMEYLDGQPLHRILNRARATIPLELHLTILADVLRGMHYAHELKDYDGSHLEIVHRDVTPHNCFVTYEGQVKVVDFGIAKAAGRASETQHGVVKGKTAYMAPEQACGQHIDRRVDIFAVGVMVAEAALRGRLWKGLPETEVICRLVGGEIPSSPKALDPSIDDELDRICRRALAFSRSERYPTAAAFQLDLERYLASKGPRPTPRELGEYVAGLFADKRAAVDKIVSSQLAQLAKDSRAVPMIMGSRTSSTEESYGGRSTEASVSVQFEAPVAPLTNGAPAAGGKATSGKSAPFVNAALDAINVAEPSSRGIANRIRNATRGLLPLILAAVVLAIATAGLTILTFSSSTAAEAPHTAGAPRRRSGKFITVTLRATPAETRFTVDGEPLQENPFIGQFESDGKDHVIRAAAPGYSPVQEVVTFADDVSMRFALTSTRTHGKN